MANTVTIYLSPDQLDSLREDNIPYVLRRSMTEAITKQHINDDGKIETLFIVVVDHPNITEIGSTETLLS
jgi:hypothetical protein